MRQDTHLLPELLGTNSLSYRGGEAVLRLPRLALRATCLDAGEYTFFHQAFEHVRITVYFSNGVNKSIAWQVSRAGLLKSRVDERDFIVSHYGT